MLALRENLRHISHDIIPIMVSANTLVTRKGSVSAI